MSSRTLFLSRALFLLVASINVAVADESDLSTRLMPPLPVPRTGAANTDKKPLEAPLPVPNLNTAAVAPSGSATDNDNSDGTGSDSSSGVTSNKNRARAFEMLKENTLPLTPDQIIELRKLLDSSQRAASLPPVTPPRPVSSSLVINLSPGVTPPVVRLAPGYVTSLVFVDSSGAPWPIVSYGLGNPDVFNVQWDMKSNMMMIQSTKAYVAGNLAVKLYGNPTPVMLSMVTSQKEVDYRVDLQVLGRGPYAQAPIMNSGPEQSPHPELIQLLDGLPPQKSRLLEVEGDNSGKAWTKDSTVYYRTKLTLLSPAWLSTMSSADGTKVYALPKTPLLLASKDGQTITIRLTGF